MSEAIAFDTHRFVKNLTDHGFTEEQAEVLANEQVNLLNSNLSTKTDVALIQQDIEVLRQATKTDIALIQRDIEVLRKETKADIANLKSDLLKWMFGALIAQGGVTVTLIVALSRSSSP